VKREMYFPKVFRRDLRSKVVRLIHTRRSAPHKKSSTAVVVPVAPPKGNPTRACVTSTMRTAESRIMLNRIIPIVSRVAAVSHCGRHDDGKSCEIVELRNSAIFSHLDVRRRIKRNLSLSFSTPHSTFSYQTEFLFKVVRFIGI